MKSIALAALAFLSIGAAPPAPGELGTSGDWIWGCDNGDACQANALAMENGEGEDLLIFVTRAAEPAAPAILHVPLGGITQPVTLAVDGTKFATLAPIGSGERTLPIGPKLAKALGDGQRLTLTYADGKPWASASLKGASAAFLYIDERQGRLGTDTALRRVGTRRATRVPPALPVIVRPAAGTKPARTLGAAAAKRLIGPDNSDCDYALEPIRPQAIRLDPRTSVVLVTHPCGNGAYNIFTSVYLVDEAGKARAAVFDVDPGMGGDAHDATNVMVNGDWDAKGKRLSTFAKGRGLGDCGTAQTFVWDGKVFKLSEQAEMGQCRGSLDYITTWRATVR